MIFHTGWDGDSTILEEWSELGSRDMDCGSEPDWRGGRVVMRPTERERRSQYTTSTIVQSYVHGLHGLIKNVQSAVYYYQDELGSTTQIANAAGCLLESYTYDVYGKPTILSAVGSVIASSLFGVHDLYAGARWMDDLGLYDMRNRFMSPETGTFLQTDPIGFKGDASNLYRYCGNDWANKTDPAGLAGALPQDSQFPDGGSGPGGVVTAADRLDKFHRDMNMGAIDASRIEQRSREIANAIPQGSENRSGVYPVAHPPVAPYGPGLIPVSQQQIAFGKAAAAAADKLTQGTAEANIAVAMNPTTLEQRFSGVVYSRPTPAGQSAMFPNLPRGNYAYSSQAHAHHDGNQVSGNDFGAGNQKQVPIFVSVNHRTWMYVPLRIPSQNDSRRTFTAPIGHLYSPDGF